MTQNESLERVLKISPPPNQPSVGARRWAGGEGVRWAWFGSAESLAEIALTLPLSRRERGHLGDFSDSL